MSLVKVDIINLALQAMGSRTTVTDAELVANSSNEAIQANLLYEKTRDSLLRMAPWDCAFNAATLTYITSLPGTPENTSPATTLWQKGQPMPPWAYEYEYPVDCLRMCWIIPQVQTGLIGGVPVYPVTTGAGPSLGTAPVGFKVAVDQFYPVTAAAVGNGGTGYAVGDVVTLAQSAAGLAPVGAPVQLLVLTAPGGVIATVSVVNQIANSPTSFGGSYFTVQSNPVAAASVAGVGGTTSSGVGATFNLTFGTQLSKRVILTNQEYAAAAYVKQVTSPSLMDPLFVDAWINFMAGRLVPALSGEKSQQQICFGQTKQSIEEARKADGNEGLTVNDVTPDFIRVRGTNYTGVGWSPNSSFDWGSYDNMFG